jgi:hypothetical protein
MTEHEASRTLVKSPPELWAELSDPSSLANHLAKTFGEIRITRLEPETAVAWEGERASGTVRIEPSGWGTRVTLTARAVEEAPSEPPPPEPAPPPSLPIPDPDPLPPAAVEPQEAPAARRGFLGRLRGWFGAQRAPSRDAPPPAESESSSVLAAVPPPGEPIPPESTPEPPAERASAQAEAPVPPAIDPAAVLVGVLDRLGAAHRRPFSHT